MSESAVLDRTPIMRRGRRLEYFTIAWNTLEGLVAVVAGAIAGSISLVGFGIDSFIEVTSGSVLLWRMSVDAEVQRRELNERRALRIVGGNSVLSCVGRRASYSSIKLLRTEKRSNALSMRHLRLMVHDSQTTQELGVQSDDDR